MVADETRNCSPETAHNLDFLQSLQSLSEKDRFVFLRYVTFDPLVLEGFGGFYSFLWVFVHERCDELAR